MLKTFKSMTSDNKLLTKLGLFIFLEIMLIICCISYSATFLKAFAILLCLLIHILINGYMLSIVKFINTKTNQILLPFWNIKKHFLLGFKYMIASNLLLIPAALIMFAFTYSYIMIHLALTPIIYHPQTVAIVFASKIFFILMILSIIFFLIVITFIAPAATLIYLKTNRFLSFYLFEEIFALIKECTLIKKCTKKYLLNSIIILILSIIIDMLYTLNREIITLNNPVFWLLLIPSIILVIFFLFSYFYHLAKIKDDAQVEFE